MDIWPQSPFECRLTYYNRQQHPIQSITTQGCHLIDRFGLWETEMEYLIVLITPKPFLQKKTSFVEVVHTPSDTWIVRHFFRDGVLSPLYSLEPNRDKCDLIRKQQILTKPVLDWPRIIHDRLFNPSKPLRYHVK